MSNFDQKQIEFLKGNFTSIAKRVGCSRYYVYLIINGRRPVNTKTARKIKDTAYQLLKILQPDE